MDPKFLRERLANNRSPLTNIRHFKFYPQQKKKPLRMKKIWISRHVIKLPFAVIYLSTRARREIEVSRNVFGRWNTSISHYPSPAALLLITFFILLLFSYFFFLNKKHKHLFQSHCSKKHNHFLQCHIFFCVYDFGSASKIGCRSAFTAVPVIYLQ